MVNIVLKHFSIQGLENGEIIPFPVWIIPFLVRKTGFGRLSKNGKYFVNTVFLIRGLDIGEIIPFPVCKNGSELLINNGKYFVK